MVITKTYCDGISLRVGVWRDFRWNQCKSQNIWSWEYTMGCGELKWGFYIAFWRFRATFDLVGGDFFDHAFDCSLFQNRGKTFDLGDIFCLHDYFLGRGGLLSRSISGWLFAKSFSLTPFTKDQEKISRYWSSSRSHFLLKTTLPTPPSHTHSPLYTL